MYSESKAAAVLVIAEEEFYAMPVSPKKCCTKQKQEKSETMYTEQEQKRQHLYSRASQLFWSKTDGLRKTFKMEDDPAPRTAKELKERLEKGLYVVDWKEGDPDYSLYNMKQAIHWRDPAVPADKEGFEAALRKMEKVYEALQDNIAILDPADALKALREFDATDFTA